MPHPKPLFPSVPQAAMLVLAHFLLRYLLTLVFHDLHRDLDLSASQIDALVALLATGLTLVPVMQVRQMTYRDLVHPSPSSAWVAAVLLVPPVLMLTPITLLLDTWLMKAVEQLWPLSAWEQQAFDAMATADLATWVATCLLAPVLEEMLFRGVLLRAFLAGHPRWAAISYSSLLFGAAHLNLYQFLLGFWLGLVLGWLFERAHSLIPCIALHAAVNTAITVLAVSASPGEPSPFEQAGPVTWGLALLLAVVGLGLLGRILRRSDAEAQTLA